MPILDEIDLELWNEYVREAISGSCAYPSGFISPKGLVAYAAAVADAALEEYQKRMKGVSSK